MWLARTCPWMPAVVLWVLAGCAGTPVARTAAPLPEGVSLLGDEIRFRGDIEHAHVDRVAALLVAHPEVRRLAIFSGGGDVDAGMRLGDLVHERGLDVRATGGLCASSCANYVFTSGRHKRIDPGTLVVWHGSPLRMQDTSITETVVAADGTRTTVTYEGEALAAYLRRPDVIATHHAERVLQEAWFERRGIDGTLTVHGQVIGCHCLWTFSVADMARFGLRDVQAPLDYPTFDPTVLGGQLKHLRLDAPR